MSIIFPMNQVAEKVCSGTVFNVTQHAVGIIVNKRVRTRIIPKRIHVRIEHVKKSACREKFVEFDAERLA